MQGSQQPILLTVQNSTNSTKKRIEKLPSQASVNASV